MDFPVHDRPDLLILTFNGVIQPTEEQISAAVISLCDRFAIDEKRVLCMPPIMYSNREYGPIFRVDGVANFVFVQQIIGRIMRQQLTQNGVNVLDEAVIMNKKGTRSEHDYKPKLIICWLRQSSMDQIVDIAIQLWLILGDMPEFLLPLRPHDKIVIVIENCSSRPHRWEERHSVRDVIKTLRQNPSHEAFILSPWAERLTRRPDDLDIIDHDLDWFGAQWFYRAIVEDDEDCTAQWCDSATMDNRLWLESCLENSIELGRQLAHYSKNNIMLSRILGAPEDDPIMTALKQLLGLAMKHHGIERVIIYCRVSPRFKFGGAGTDNEEWAWSTERQVDILSRLVPDRFRKVRGKLDIIRDTHKSAYSDMDRGFLSTLEKSTDRACVLAVSMDRITRRIDHLSKLREVMHQNGRGHMGVCFLWDQLTTLNAVQSLLLHHDHADCPEVITWDTAAQSMRQFAPSPHHNSFLQPVVWCPTSLEPKLQHEDIVVRHVCNGEAFCLATRSPARCAPSDRKVQVPAKLAQTEVLQYGQYFTKERGQRWLDFICDYLTVTPQQVEFLYRLTRVSYTCQCVSRKSCDPGDCDCNCTFCKTQITCTCVASQDCQCSEICSCACDHCHSRGKRVKRKTRADEDPQSTASVVKKDEGNVSAQSPQLPAESAMPTITAVNNDSGNPPKKRCGKAPKSCDRCYAKSKVCSKEDPCASCVRAKVPCTYNVRDAAVAAEVARALATPNEKLCSVEGCYKAVPGKRWNRCYAHENERKKQLALTVNCLNIHCDKKREPQIPWCSIACYIQCTPVPATCQEPKGCTTVVPPGLGVRCEKHPIGSYKNNNYATLRRLRKAYELQHPTFNPM